MSSTNFVHDLSDDSEFKVEDGRYILYVALGCPYAMRAAMARTIKGLENVIDLVVLDYFYSPDGLGLKFSTPDKIAECHSDPIMDAKYLRELYLKVCPDYSGIFSVPMLWDRKLNKIVNNESELIVRIFDKAFTHIKCDVVLYPEDLRDQIDSWNERIMKSLGVAPSLAGKAENQETYNIYANTVKDELIYLNELFGKQKFLIDNRLTEADIRLFSLVIRHDPISTLLYRINHIYVRDLTNVMRWMKDILDIPGIRPLINITHIKGMAFSKKILNPSAIIPLGDGFVLP